MDYSRDAIAIFVAWIKVKIKINISERPVLFNEGEVWWASLGHNVGVEANGKNEQFERPVLIVKKFNKDSFWAVSISSQLKAEKYYYTFKLKGVRYCLNLSQLRLLSSRRLLRRVGHFPSTSLREVHDQLRNMI